MFLLDTDVISERRKGAKADPGVKDFIDRVDHELFLPVQVIGELQSGIEQLRNRRDDSQAALLQTWLDSILSDASIRVLAFDTPCAITWGKLMAGSDQHAIDRQIAAIALAYDLTIVTRNTRHYDGTGARVLNPFLADRSPSAAKQ
jgi:toxin FitB